MTGQTPPTNGADLTDTTGRPAGPTAGPVAATIASTVAAAVEPRRVPLPSGPINLRDVGGYPTADGRTVRWRTLLRSGSLHGLDGRGRAVLAQIGLRTVVDLREDAEVTRAPDQLGRLAVEHRRIPVYTLPVTRQRTADDVAGGSASVGSFTATEAIRAASASGDLGSIYDHIVDHLGARLTAAVLALAAPDALPAIVHCSAGKDRTGLVIALVLDLVGVPAEVIAQDFALTSYFLRDEAAATVQRMSSWLSAEGTPLPPALLDSPPELILRSLARIHASHGGTRAYLLAHGATGHALDRLVEALLVPADTPASRLER
ncbi:tyrosine-protein phosphatase, partial [Protofrankia coriariae]